MHINKMFWTGTTTFWSTFTNVEMFPVHPVDALVRICCPDGSMSTYPHGRDE